MDTTVFTNVLLSTLSIFLISITIGFLLFTIYIILVLRKIHSFLNIIKKESEKISQDIENVRGKINTGGTVIASSASYLLSLLKKKAKKSKKIN
jgi:uncharacterized protein YoxC